MSMQGWTALMWAAHHGCEHLVELLLAKGADANMKDPEVSYHA